MFQSICIQSACTHKEKTEKKMSLCFYSSLHIVHFRYHHLFIYLFFYVAKMHFCDQKRGTEKHIFTMFVPCILYCILNIVQRNVKKFRRSMTKTTCMSCFFVKKKRTCIVHKEEKTRSILI